MTRNSTFSDNQNLMLDDILFIVNPISGKNGRKAKAVSYLESKGCRIAFTQYAGHAEKMAREASEGTVVAVGGDGTVNEVARALAGTGRKMGIIPCGSGDGLARKLGLRVTPAKSLEIIEKGHTQKMDCGMINGKPFFSVCGVGLDAIVSERFAKAGKRGVNTYITEALNEWKDFAPEHYLIDIDGIKMEKDAVLITVANSNQWGNGAKVAPHAETDDGKFDITIVSMFKTIEIPVLAAQLMDGHFDRNHKVECLRGEKVIIHRQSPGPAHFDGDFFETGKDIEISLLADKLDILVP